MSDYTVTATHWEHGWELHIDGVGVTQSHNLRDADRMIRDYLRISGHADFETAGITVNIDLGGLEAEVDKIRAERDAAARAQEQAAQHARVLARKLQSSGLTGADVAKVMDVSPQRASQLLRAS